MFFQAFRSRWSSLGKTRAKCRKRGEEMRIPRKDLKPQKAEGAGLFLERGSLVRLGEGRSVESLEFRGKGASKSKSVSVSKSTRVVARLGSAVAGPLLSHALHRSAGRRPVIASTVGRSHAFLSRQRLQRCVQSSGAFLGDAPRRESFGSPSSAGASRPRKGDTSSPEDGEANGVERSACSFSLSSASAKEVRRSLELAVLFDSDSDSDSEPTPPPNSQLISHHPYGLRIRAPKNPCRSFHFHPFLTN